MTWRYTWLIRWPHVFGDFRRGSTVGVVTNTKERDSAGSLHDYLDLGYIECIQLLGDGNILSLRGHVEFCCGSLYIAHPNLDIADDVEQTNIFNFPTWTSLKVEHNDPSFLIRLPLYLTLVSLLLYNENVAEITC